MLQIAGNCALGQKHKDKKIRTQLAKTRTKESAAFRFGSSQVCYQGLLKQKYYDPITPTCIVYISIVVHCIRQLSMQLCFKYTMVLYSYLNTPISPSQKRQLEGCSCIQVGSVFPVYPAGLGCNIVAYRLYGSSCPLVKQGVPDLNARA